jgi:hypothetical protein
MIVGFWFHILGIVTTGFMGVWAGRCWQRAIYAEKALDEIVLQFEREDTVSEEVISKVVHHVKTLNAPTADDFNSLIEPEE